MKASLLSSIVMIGATLPPGALPAAAADTPAYISTAVADASRPEQDTARDAHRKPAETLDFYGIHPGQTIVELFPGGGYFTRLLSKVVGADGHVTTVGFPRRPNAPANAPDPEAPIKELAAQPGYGNISLTQLKDGVISVATPVDVVWTSLNYHDLHNGPNANIAAFNASVFKALKPGGIYVVIDHAAAPGSGTQATSTLHRIDPAAVKAEVTAAGFEFAGESQALHNPDDNHELKVFDPQIRGETDQFMLKFRKPD